MKGETGLVFSKLEELKLNVELDVFPKLMTGVSRLVGVAAFNFARNEAWSACNPPSPLSVS